MTGSPSLSIAEGRDGRVLVLCRAGCETKAILAAMGLRMGDLFHGPPATPDQIRERREQEARQQAVARARRLAHGQTCDALFKLERVSSELGSKLMRLPDDSADGISLARLFHHVQDRIRATEAKELEMRS